MRERGGEAGLGDTAEREHRKPEAAPWCFYSPSVFRHEKRKSFNESFARLLRPNSNVIMSSNGCLSEVPDASGGSK